MSVFFTSDLHLGHERIVELSHRPFSDIHEHDAEIMDRWEETVKPDDIVWVLGDVSIEGTWKYALRMMAALPGRKRLVTGNHDQAWMGKSTAMKYQADYLKVFEVVVPWARASVEGVKVNLSHFPYEGDHTKEARFDEYRLRASSRPLLHGHTHSNDVRSRVPYDSTSARVTQVHVGVDAWAFTPVASHTILPLLVGPAYYSGHGRAEHADQMKPGQWTIVKGVVVYA